MNSLKKLSLFCCVIINTSVFPRSDEGRCILLGFILDVLSHWSQEFVKNIAECMKSIKPSNFPPELVIFVLELVTLVHVFSSDLTTESMVFSEGGVICLLRRSRIFSLF